MSVLSMSDGTDASLTATCSQTPDGFPFAALGLQWRQLLAGDVTEIALGPSTADELFLAGYAEGIVWSVRHPVRRDDLIGPRRQSAGPS